MQLGDITKEKYATDVIVEEKREVSSNTDPDEEFGGYDERRKLERKLLWKIDCRMFILVIISIMDHLVRESASASRFRGFQNDLHLEGEKFNIVLSVYYVGFIIMQVPSNMFLNYIGRPSLYLPLNMLVWGMISILIGITNNFVGALLARFFLGFVQAAFFPGAWFLLTKWYKRDELCLRLCVLYCGNITSNAFSSLLASGILDGMQGKLGRAAWRWLFYIEGGLSIVVALAALFILPDFPTTTRWLSLDERKLAMRRMAEDGGIHLEDQDTTPVDRDSSRESTVEDGNDVRLPPGTVAAQRPRWFQLGGQGEGLWMAISDWKVWWLTIILTTQINALSFNIFFPTLTATLGFNPTITLILVAPPFIVAAVGCFIVSRHSDKHAERFWHIVGPFTIGLLGYVIAMSTTTIAARYFALFVMALSYCGNIILFAWISNSIPRPSAKRAVAIAITNCFSQLGNVSGSYVWQSKWGPSYRNSYAICFSCQVVTIIMCWVFRRHLRTLNQKLEEEERRSGKGEKGFRYLL